MLIPCKKYFKASLVLFRISGDVKSSELINVALFCSVCKTEFFI